MNIKIFLVMLLTLSFFSIFGKKNKASKIFLYFLIIPLIIFATFRPSWINVDTEVYMRYYNTVPKISYLFDYNNYYFEKGYVFLNMILKGLYFPYEFLFFLISTTSLTLVYNSILKYTKYIYLSFFLYFVNFYFLNELLIMRTGLAFSILFFSLRYLKKNKYKYFFGIFFASLFHRISFIMFLPLFLLQTKIMQKTKFIVLSLMLGIVIGRLDTLEFLVRNFNFMLPQKLLYYFTNYKYAESSYRSLFLLVPMLYYFLLNYKKYKKYYFFDESVLLLYLAILTRVLFIRHEALNRISLLLSMPIIILPDIFLQNVESKKKRFFYKLGITVFYTILLFWFLRGDNIIKLVY